MVDDHKPEVDFLKTRPVEPDAENFNKAERKEHASTTFAPESMIAGKYRVLSVLGKGGMGVVYKVEQVYLQQTFALKAILSDTSDFAWRRFQLEAKALARLDHPSIVKLHDFGMITEGNPYFVMDFAQGDTLSVVLKKAGVLDIEEALSIFIPLARGLAYAHKEGVVHRDLKPTNVTVKRREPSDKEFDVKILDFGIAKVASDGGQSLTATGEIFGSPFYMSPEQSSGSAIDHRSDIYSFGCMMFEALTGAPPFIGESAFSTIMKHQSETPPTLTEASLGKPFAQGIENVIGKLLAKLPEERYQNFEEVAIDLLDLKSDHDSKEPVSRHRHPQSSKGGTKHRSRKACFVGALFIIGMATLGLGAWEGWQRLSGAERQAPDGIEIDSSGALSKRKFTTVSSNPEEHVFEFPLSVSLGTIKDQTTGVKRKAQGRVDFPKGHRLKFEADLPILAKPSYFKRFLPDDLQSLSLAKNTAVTDDEIQYIRHMTGMRELDLNGTSITDNGLSNIAMMSKLTTLKLSDTSCTANGIMRLPFSKSLKDLEANAITDNDKLLSGLKGAKNLERLHILNSVLAGGLKNDDLKRLRNFTSLRDLSLAGHSKISDAGLEQLRYLVNLEKLNLISCSVSPGCVQYLRPLNRLQELTIDTNGWSEEEKKQLVNSLPPACKLHLVGKSNAWQPLQKRFSDCFK